DSINSIFNFIYPFLYYFFFLIIFNITLMFVLNKKDERINKNVIFFLIIPGFIFLCINNFYANTLNIEDIQQINNYQRAIVPFLSYSVSSVIAEICFIFPALSLFFYSYSKYNTYDSVVLSFTPVVLIYIFNLLI